MTEKRLSICDLSLSEEDRRSGIWVRGDSNALEKLKEHLELVSRLRKDNETGTPLDSAIRKVFTTDGIQFLFKKSST